MLPTAWVEQLRQGSNARTPEMAAVPGLVYSQYGEA
jgi:hypothetical protein